MVFPMVFSIFQWFPYDFPWKFAHFRPTGPIKNPKPRHIGRIDLHGGWRELGQAPMQTCGVPER
jgi:hypothetical protein